MGRLHRDETYLPLIFYINGFNILLIITLKPYLLQKPNARNEIISSVTILTNEIYFSNSSFFNLNIWRSRVISR